jgi:hypothetical protein
MANDLIKDELNRFKDYEMEELRTTLSTKTDLLNDEEKNIVEFAVNKAWINPKFKMKYFQAEDQLTPFHKLRQYLLELRATEESIEGVEYVIKKLPTELEIVQIKKQRAADELEKKEWELKEIEIKRDLDQAKRRVAHNYIERHTYLDLIKDFLDSDEGKSPDGTSLLEAFNTPREDEYEKYYWTIRLGKQAALDMLSYGNIGVGNMTAITVLPEEMQNEIYAIAHHYSLQMKQHQEKIKLDMVKRLEIEDAERSMPKKDQNNKVSYKESNNGSLADVYSL